MMQTIDRSPLSDDDRADSLTAAGTIAWMTDNLADLEAMAWLIDNRTAAKLIGAARLALRET